MTFIPFRKSTFLISSSLVIAFLSIFALVPAHAADSLAQSASAIQEEIRSAGAQATVRDLWRSQLKWSALLQHVQSGDRMWLKVADDLKSGADGGQLETLRIAVSQSIQKHAENFLALAWPVFGNDTCADLQIEPTAKQHKDFVSNTRKSLASVTVESLRSRRDSCLQALTETQTH